MAMMRLGRVRAGCVMLTAFLGTEAQGAQAQASQPPLAAPSAAPELPPLLLGLAIDGAGMGSADLRRSLNVVLAVFDRLPAGSKMAVGSFSGDQRILQPPTADRKVLTKLLQGYKAGQTGVALPDGLFDLVAYLANQEAAARSILLISGGNAREGDLQFEDPLNAASSRGIRIVALGLGQGDGKQLRRVAKLTGGDYVHLEVADPAMLAMSILPPAARVAPVVTAATPAPTPVSPAGPPAASGGLLGVAAVFMGFGGLLILGVIVLLIRRMSDRPAPEPSPAPVQSSSAVIASKPRPGPLARDEPAPGDDFPLEKTLVVNANPILRALSGPAAGRNFPLSPSGPTSLGRSRRNDIVVPEDAASAQHCRIDREGDSYVLYDLGATNGTWVNGSRTERAVLGHGDRLKVGETVFTVSLFGDRS